MELVECSKEYWEFVRVLRMDERTMDGFVQRGEITPIAQEHYMQLFSKYYRIALIDNVPVGFVGSVDNDIRVCTHPDHQGKGIGKFMINECMKIWPNSYAKVKKDNVSSLKLFQSSGFNQFKEDDEFIYLKK